MSQILHGIFCMQYLGHTYTKKKKVFIVYLRIKSFIRQTYLLSLKTYGRPKDSSELFIDSQFNFNFCECLCVCVLFHMRFPRGNRMAEQGEAVHSYSVWNIDKYWLEGCGGRGIEAVAGTLTFSDSMLVFHCLTLLPFPNQHLFLRGPRPFSPWELCLISA